LRELCLIPLELGLDITEVAHLQGLSQTTVLDNLAEGNHLVHNLELNAVGDSHNLEELTRVFDTVDLDHDVVLEVGQTNFGLELDLNRQGLLGLQDNLLHLGSDRQEGLLESFNVLRGDCKLDTLNATVDEGDYTSSGASNRHSTQVSRLVSRVLQVKVERDSLAGHLKIDEVKSVVEIQPDGLMVLSDLSGGEHNWDLELLVLSGHQDGSWNQWEVEEVLLLESRLKGDCLRVLVGDLKHLLDRSRLRSDEAGAEVEDVRVEFDARLASFAAELEVVLGTTDDGQHHLEVFHLVLGDRSVVDFDDHFGTCLDSASLGRNTDRVFVQLTFPDEVEVKFSVVRQDNILGLLLVDEEFTEIEVEGLAGLNFDTGLVSEDRVVDLVTFALDVEDERASLALNVALKVVVVSQLELGRELDLNG